jgi:RimJ/RimL family protein N-acetyltransferase
LTGSKSRFTQDEVVGFFRKCVDSPDRYDFLILAPDGHIIGESVLNEIDPELRSANFRIGIFHSEGYGKGIGSWAIHTYEKTGFKHEGVLRDAVKDGDSYGDDILMAIPEDEWRQMKERMSTSL